MKDPLHDVVPKFYCEFEQDDERQLRLTVTFVLCILHDRDLPFCLANQLFRCLSRLDWVPKQEPATQEPVVAGF